mmetsp:Transcript_12809/g.37663  ORF Transcript_12809/g.37663 Transcript_12809/m.37663 type:complete len:88 (+) Transcript_12809:740-1003(+)
MNVLARVTETTAQSMLTALIKTEATPVHANMGTMAMVRLALISMNVAARAKATTAQPMLTVSTKMEDLAALVKAVSLAIRTKTLALQ